MALDEWVGTWMAFGIWRLGMGWYLIPLGWFKLYVWVWVWHFGRGVPMALV